MTEFLGTDGGQIAHEVTGLTAAAEQVVAARPELVWDLVADVTRVGGWSPECIRADWLAEPGRPEPGARFTGHNRFPNGFEYEVTVLLGGWLTATAVIAGHGWYHTLPWFPVAAAGFLGTLLALSRIPVVARALAGPGMVSRLELPHTLRLAGVAFLLYLAFGRLPTLFALPAGLGDIATGIAAPLVARRLARGTGRRAALWFNAFGMTDLVVALTLGALTGFGLLNVTPSSAPITKLPLALIPTATVPLLFVLHITSMSTLARAPRPAPSAAGPLVSGATPRAAMAPSPASRAR